MSSSVKIEVPGHRLNVEYAFVGIPTLNAPWLVMLHEGLGSVAMWRDFPERLCSMCGMRGLVYSRPGYGRSTPRAPGEHWQPDFMHYQATTVLPALLEKLDAPPRYHLLGHSDGGSIALIHAATSPGRVASAVLMSPHIFIEKVSLDSIEAARLAYLNTDLRERLARYQPYAPCHRPR